MQFLGHISTISSLLFIILPHLLSFILPQQPFPPHLPYKGTKDIIFPHLGTKIHIFPSAHSSAPPPPQYLKIYGVHGKRTPFTLDRKFLTFELLCPFLDHCSMIFSYFLFFPSLTYSVSFFPELSHFPSSFYT